jgi:hypothetical protein
MIMVNIYWQLSSFNRDSQAIPESRLAGMIMNGRRGARVECRLALMSVL